MYICVYTFLCAPHFLNVRHQYGVATSTCRHQYGVATSTVSPPVRCRHQYGVPAHSRVLFSHRRIIFANHCCSHLCLGQSRCPTSEHCSPFTLSSPPILPDNFWNFSDSEYSCLTYFPKLQSFKQRFSSCRPFPRVGKSSQPETSPSVHQMRQRITSLAYTNNDDVIVTNAVW